MPAAERDATSPQTYLNPVHARDFPDPFVTKFAGEYFAYCTGFWRDGRAFGVMRSRDLVHWIELDGAMEPLPGGHTCYWAPEVSYRDGKFLMYYSVGNETLMQVRVAVANDPAGLFIDSGRRLTKEDFAIDPHVFTDRDGARYLFYATDFLNYSHIGTGTVVDRMRDDFTLAGRPRPVTRARYDWQVYDPNRKEKCGVRWHTVEGPFVLARKGRYYEMFSGGNWQNVSYGVSYATSDKILSKEEWEQHADGEKVLPILRTIPEKVIGPGHNSVVRAPDNQQLFCVYHRWAEEGRVLAIDRLEFVGERLSVLGPTTTAQPAPINAWFADHFDEPCEEGLGDEWECASGLWSVRGGEARQDKSAGEAEARCRASARSFVAELSLRALDVDAAKGAVFGVLLYEGDAAAWRFVIEPAARRAVLRRREGEGWSKGREFKLPKGFRPDAYHLLRLEVDHSVVCVTLDEGAIRSCVTLDAGRINRFDYRFSLLTDNTCGAFKGFALTPGWDDDFADTHPEAHGWMSMPLQTKGALARYAKREAGRVTDETLTKRLPLDGLRSYELVFNIKIDQATVKSGARVSYKLFPGLEHKTAGELTVKLLRQGRRGWALALLWRRETALPSPRLLRLPRSFNPFEFHQIRFRCERDRTTVRLESEVLGEIRGSASGIVGLESRGSTVVVDAVRLTAIKEL